MKPTTVDEYIEQFSGEQKAKLEELRGIVNAALPGTTEALKWGSPAVLDQDGMILVVYGGFKQHINLVVTPSAKQDLMSDLTDYVTGKGSVQLSYDKPLPKQLIEKIVTYRAQEYRERGVKWM